MKTYVLTFGQQYPRDAPHPRFPGAHRDGFVVIVAADEEDARSFAVERLGEAWAFLYTLGEFYENGGADLFPLGELDAWVAT